MPSLLEIIKKTTEFFSGRGVENPRLNAEVLIGHALGLPRMQLYLRFEQPLAEADLEKIRPLVRRRGQHEPLQYIVGETEFAGLRLKTDRRALIPRPETEYLVELIGARGGPPPGRGVDLGTGTGALAIALAKLFPESRWLATDLSAEALALAAENIAAAGVGDRVALRQSDWWEALPADSRFDLVVANPPYLSVAEVAATAPEVREFEPRGALTPGDDDGLGALRVILAGAAAFLNPGGRVALETGSAQEAPLRALAGEAGLRAGEVRMDLAGRPRYFFAEQ